MLREVSRRRQGSQHLWERLLKAPRLQQVNGWLTKDPMRGLPFVVAGTNVVWQEAEEVVETAMRIKDVCDKLAVPVVFKASWDKANRTRFDAYRGLGLEKGLDILQSIKSKVGVPILTDVHETCHVNAVAQVADILQIPSFLCRQTDLLVAAAETGRIINIKRGQFASPVVMSKAVEKVRKLGNNPRVMVTERGLTFGMEDLVFDPRQIPRLRRACGPDVPILVDVTHACQTPPYNDRAASGGEREMVPVVARAAAATGVDGIYIECHPNVDNAPVDSNLQLALYDLEGLLSDVLAISRTVNHCTEKYRDASDLQEST